MPQFKKKDDWSKSYVTKNIINGLMVLLPIIIVIAVVLFLVNFLTGIITPVTNMIDPNEKVTDLVLNLLAFIVLLALFFAIGVFSNTTKGKGLYSQFEEKVLNHIPMYANVRNIVNSFRGVGEQPFKRVVLIDAYGSGALMTGFVVERLNEEMVVVYVPTAPNPTNGFVFHVKEEDLIETNAKSEAAMGTVIAVGAGSKNLFSNAVYNKADHIQLSEETVRTEDENDVEQTNTENNE